MSMWCPKCNRVTYNKTKCDFCGHIMEETSNSSDIPKPKPVQKKETSSFLDISDEVEYKLIHENKKTINKNFTESTRNTYKDKKIRGDEYEEYIAEHYRQLGYDVIEHGKEKGVKDGGIDLIAKLDNEVILIQCKDWNENNSHKIDHKDIKVLRTDANDFLEKNPDYKNYEIKLKYTLSGNFLHKSAEKHMEECKENISYEIIKPTYRIEEQKNLSFTKKPSRQKSTKENNVVKKIFIGVLIMTAIAIVVVSMLLDRNNKTERDQAKSKLMLQMKN